MASKKKGQGYMNTSNTNKSDYIQQGLQLKAKHFQSSLDAHGKEPIQVSATKSKQGTNLWDWFLRVVQHLVES